MSMRGLAVVMAAVLMGGVVGCNQNKPARSPYVSEMGKQITIDDTPKEVREFVRASYPDGQIQDVREWRHTSAMPTQMHHYEVHLLLPGNRKKVVEYNTFERKTPGVEKLDRMEVQGSGAK